jgi:hypothetical protein
MFDRENWNEIFREALTAWRIQLNALNRFFRCFGVYLFWLFISPLLTVLEKLV